MLFRRLMGAIKPNLILTFLSTLPSTSNVNSYTFSSVDLGPEDPTRHLVVAIEALRASSPVTSVGLTVNGISATPMANCSGGAGITISLFLVKIPTGTTGTLSITLNTAAQACRYGLWSVTGAEDLRFEGKSGAVSTGTSGSFTFSSVGKGDILFEALRIRSANAATYSLSGVTENYDISTESGVSGSVAGAGQVLAASNNYSVGWSTIGGSPDTSPCAARVYR